MLLLPVPAWAVATSTIDLARGLRAPNASNKSPRGGGFFMSIERIAFAMLS